VTAPVAIVGGGPAGMAIALALHRNGVASEIIDARARGAAIADRRILALSHGARQILEWLDVWGAIPHTPIATIHISHQGGLGRTKITATDEGVPALGYVLAAGDLAASLDAALLRTDVPFRERTRVAGPPDGPLTIWAEGVVDDDAAVVRDYGQHAVICTATADEPHAGRAWERFTPEGPVAALPWGRDYAVVLTAAAHDADAVAALADGAFLARLQTRFGGRVRFTSASERLMFPLGLRYRKSAVAARQAWIGNAAQTLHPVAGQGFNLALRDIYELARILADAPDPGAPELLARYDAARRLDRHGAMGFTDTLVRLFSNDNPLLRHARGAGLLALDLFPPARHFVARRMMFGARGYAVSVVQCGRSPAI
jgi:2-octaprenyl-6-methoxyphenol hydroxylase